MPTRNVVLTEYQAALIERLVASGRYQNASEVLRQGLRLVEREEADLAALLAKVDEAEAAYSAGDYTVLSTDADLDALMASLDDPA